MKLVKLSSHETFKFNPKEFMSCVPKGLAFMDSIPGGVGPAWYKKALWSSDLTSSEITGHKLQGCSRASVFS